VLAQAERESTAARGAASGALVWGTGVAHGGDAARTAPQSRNPNARQGLHAKRFRYLGERFPALIEMMGDAMGMGMVYGLATLQVPYMQAKFERLGWQLIGIIPGFDNEMVGPGVVKRVYEAIYTKVLVDEEDFVRPRYADMTPKTTEFFELLYPGKATAA
jgi:hypothetical protein